MDYKFEFLEKFLRTFVNLQKKYDNLEVIADSVPIGYDIEFEDWIEDYKIDFIFKGNKFTAKPIFEYVYFHGSIIGNKFKIIIKDTNSYEFEQVLDMNEKFPKILKFWADVLKKLDADLKLSVPSDFYYNKWFDDKVRNNKIIKTELYNEVIKFISPSELEKELEFKFKHSNDIPTHLRTLKNTTNIEMLELLHDKIYIIFSYDEFFILDNIKASLKKYEDEQIKSIKEIINREFSNWELI